MFSKKLITYTIFYDFFSSYLNFSTKNYCSAPQATPKIPIANNPNIINNGFTFFFNEYMHTKVNKI